MDLIFGRRPRSSLTLCSLLLEFIVTYNSTAQSRYYLNSSPYCFLNLFLNIIPTANQDGYHSDGIPNKFADFKFLTLSIRRHVRESGPDRVYSRDKLVQHRAAYSSPLVRCIRGLWFGRKSDDKPSRHLQPGSQSGP
jgi:hypothetical protein